jgi:dTMP kinase
MLAGASMRRFWVTLEGIEGVGKTHISQLLAQRLGADCMLLSELTDLAADGLPGQVVAALSRENDVFLRTGHPLTETFALLALKAREYERLQTADVDPRMIIEDRGVDTVALYQAAILAAGRPIEDMYSIAWRIYATAAHWRPAPDATVLLVDDFEACVHRFADRLSRAVHDDERTLMTHADRLYALQASAEPQRFSVIDRRGQSTAQTVDNLHRICAQWMSRGRETCET